MPLFGSSKVSYLGIDIGTSGIKIVELANQGGRPQLVTYGFIEKTAEETKNTSDQEDASKIASKIKKICKKSKTTTLSTIASLPAASVFSSIISLPETAKKELDTAIKYEAKKFIPMPIEEMVLDYKIIRPGKKEKISKSLSFTEEKDKKSKKDEKEESSKKEKSDF